MSLSSIPHIVLILSGKGGVGKSSVTTQTALTLSLQGYNVGVLDVDLTGPNIPRFFGVEGSKVTQAQGGLIPVTVHDEAPLSDADSVHSDSNTSRKRKRGALHCMSLGFILSSRDTAVIWRGPKKTAMVRQFLTQTIWPQNLDYLLIDTPPGTSDEHISLLETLLIETAANPSQLSGAIVVTTPQAIAVSDVKKELNFCKKTNIKVLGVVENMAGFVCPHCRECTNVFAKGGGEVMSREFAVPFLGSVPIDPAFVGLIEEGTRPVYPEGTVVEGIDFGKGHEANGSLEQGDDLLVEKYKSCSLWPLFNKMITKLVSDVDAATPA